MINQDKNPTPRKTTYFNYKVSIGHAFLFFIITFFVGQILNTLISLPAFSYPILSHVLFPLGFLVGFGASAIIIMLLKGLHFRELKNFFHLKVSPIHIFLAILLYLVSLPIAEYLSMLVPTEGNVLLENLYESFLQSFELIFEYKIAAFIMVCILAPILEELIFRGLILRGMLNYGVNPWGAILLSAFLFGVAHFNPWQFFGAGFIGIILGFVYWRTQSLILCVFLHFLNNFIGYIITLSTESMEETIFPADYMILGGAVVLTSVIGYYFYNKSMTTALTKVEE